MTELLNCPFCGGEAIYSEEAGPYENYVACAACGACVAGAYLEDPKTVETWNTRTPQWNTDMETAKQAGWIMLFTPCEQFPTSDMTHWIAKWSPHYDDVGGWIDQDDALVLRKGDPTKWMHLPEEGE